MIIKGSIHSFSLGEQNKNLFKFSIGSSRTDKKEDCRKITRRMICNLVKKDKRYKYKKIDIRNSDNEYRLGQPILYSDGVESKLKISISHDNRICFVACSDSCIGIDTSQIRSFKKYEYLFRDCIEQINVCVSSDYFYTLLWTIKESFTKSIGMGLKFGFNSVVVKNLDLLKNEIILEVSDKFGTIEHSSLAFYYFTLNNYIFMICIICN